MPASLFSPHQVDELLEKELTGAEWFDIFKQKAASIDPLWFSKLEDPAVPPSAIKLPAVRPALVIPATSTLIELHEMFAAPPSLSFDSTESEDSGADLTWQQEVQPMALMAYVAKLTGRMRVVRRTWAKPFMEIEAAYRLIVEDMKRLQQVTTGLTLSVGTGQPGASVRTGLDKLQTEIDELESTQELMGDAIEDRVTAALSNSSEVSKSKAELAATSRLLEQCRCRLELVEQRNATYEARFDAILPLLTGLSRNGFSTGSDGMFGSRLETMDSRITALAATVRMEGTPLGSLEEQVMTLKEQMRVLEHRVVGGGLKIGHIIFQSFEELVAWTKTGLPTGRFGLLVDGHSLLEFFSLSGHLDAEAHAQSIHNSQKTGFKTMLETRIATSMQNLLPSPFGKTSSDKLDDPDLLPSITDPDKFDSGSSGIRHQIPRNLRDVSHQLESQINIVYNGYPDAKQMALEMLLQSKRFVMELLQYMSQDYMSWLNRGYAKKPAWRLTSKCVRRIFEEMQSARVSGRDACDPADTDRTSAAYLWAAGQTHVVQQEFLKHQFSEHPAINGVLSHHVASTHTAADSAGATTETIRKLQQKVDSLEHKINHSNKAVKNRKGKGVEGGL